VSDSSASDDAAGSRSRSPPVSSETNEPDTTPPPLAVGVTLWREGFLVGFGVLALLTGVNGVWFALGGGLDASRYSVLNLAGDVAYVTAGAILLVAAAGSAVTRLRRE